MTSFKPGLAFECFIIEISYKSQNRKSFVVSKITLFAGDKKTGKNLKQNISLYLCTISYYFQN